MTIRTIELSDADEIFVGAGGRLVVRTGDPEAERRVEVFSVPRGCISYFPSRGKVRAQVAFGSPTKRALVIYGGASSLSAVFEQITGISP